MKTSRALPLGAGCNPLVYIGNLTWGDGDVGEVLARRAVRPLYRACPGWLCGASRRQAGFDASSGRHPGLRHQRQWRRRAIAGYYIDQSGHVHGFVRAANGTVTSFDVPGATDTWAWSMNDKGAITGYWSPDHSYHYQAFVRSAAGNITTPDRLVRLHLDAVARERNPALTNRGSGK